MDFFLFFQKCYVSILIMSAQADQPRSYWQVTQYMYKYKWRALKIHDTVSEGPCDYKARRDHEYSYRRGSTTRRIILSGRISRQIATASSMINGVPWTRWCRRKDGLTGNLPVVPVGTVMITTPTGLLVLGSIWHTSISKYVFLVLKYILYRVSKIYFNMGILYSGAQPWLKSWGGQGLGPNTGALAPRARPNAGLGVWCERGSPPPTVRVRGVLPPENFWKLRC